MKFIGLSVSGQSRQVVGMVSREAVGRSPERQENRDLDLSPGIFAAPVVVAVFVPHDGSGAVEWAEKLEAWTVLGELARCPHWWSRRVASGLMASARYN
jgi:hypothetical protein